MSLLKKAVLIILLALAAMMPCMADSYTLSTRINNVNWLGGFGWGDLLEAEIVEAVDAGRPVGVDADLHLHGVPGGTEGDRGGAPFAGGGSLRRQAGLVAVGQRLAPWMDHEPLDPDERSAGAEVIDGEFVILTGLDVEQDAVERGPLVGADAFERVGRDDRLRGRSRGILLALLLVFEHLFAFGAGVEFEDAAAGAVGAPEAGEIVHLLPVESFGFPLVEIAVRQEIFRPQCDGGEEDEQRESAHDFTPCH